MKDLIGLLVLSPLVTFCQLYFLTDGIGTALSEFNLVLMVINYLSFSSILEIFTVFFAFFAGERRELAIKHIFIVFLPPIVYFLSVGTLSLENLFIGFKAVVISLVVAAIITVFMIFWAIVERLIKPEKNFDISTLTEEQFDRVVTKHVETESPHLSKADKDDLVKDLKNELKNRLKNKFKKRIKK